MAFIKQLETICSKCKSRKAVVQYSDSVMDFTHFGAIPICRQCYIKKIEMELKQMQNNLNTQRKLLVKEDKEKLKKKK